MILEQNIPQWQLDAPRLNDILNDVVRPFRLWAGRLGIVIFIILGLILLIPAYLFFKFTLKRLGRKLEAKKREFLSMLANSESPEFRKNWRFVSSKQLELKRYISIMKKHKLSRDVSSGLIMRKFLKQEDKFISKLEKINNDLRVVLYPNTQRTFTQDELKAMLPRSEHQDDLADKELDALIRSELSI